MNKSGTEAMVAHTTFAHFLNSRQWLMSFVLFFMKRSIAGKNHKNLVRTVLCVQTSSFSYNMLPVLSVKFTCLSVFAFQGFCST